jgi:hypothetical protein
MTKSWQKRHWFLVIVGICLLILILWPSSGVADGIRVIAHGLLDLILKVGQEIIVLIGQLINKI